MAMQLTHYGQDILRKKTTRVSEIDDSILQLIEDMFETMYHENGIGLAANQVGVDLAIATIDISHMDEDIEPFVIINPEIVEKDGTEVMDEGCLSIPGVREEVKRAERVTVEYMDREGKKVHRDAEGLLARVLQHETDHLNGKFYVDRISPLKRRFIQNKLNSIARHGFQADEE